MDNAEQLEQRVRAAALRTGLSTAEFDACCEQWGFTSAPVLGCLLALVREAWGAALREARPDDPRVVSVQHREYPISFVEMRRTPGPAYYSVVVPVGGATWTGVDAYDGVTEAEALVLALEKAP